jgi:hypothetical protein
MPLPLATSSNSSRGKIRAGHRATQRPAQPAAGIATPTGIACADAAWSELT